MPKVAPTFSIVIPAYKEARIIGTTLEKLTTYLKNQNLSDSTEVVLVVASGGDATAKICREFKDRFKYFELIEPGHKVGKGRDVRAGMLAARGAYIMFMDADLSTPVHYIGKVFTTLKQGDVDIVIGQRSLLKTHKGMRLVGSIASNLMVQLLLLPGYKDTQCGFKAFTAEASKKLFEPLNTMGWGFDLEILSRAKSAHYKVGKIDIPDWTDSKSSKSGLVGESSAAAFYSTFKELLRIISCKLRGNYRSK